MATDEPGRSGSQGERGVTGLDDPVTVGEYTWNDFRQEVHDGGSFDRGSYLGFRPHETADRLQTGASAAATLTGTVGPIDVPEGDVVKGFYTWAEFLEEHGGSDPAEDFGFDPESIGSELAAAGEIASEMSGLIEERTVDVNPEIDEEAFFSNRDGTTTLVNRYDLEKAVPQEKKSHFVEENRYWVNKPYACVFIFKSMKENEYKYYVIEPHLTDIERNLQEFLGKKLKKAIKYSDDEVVVQGSEGDRASVIQREAERLLDRYDLYSPGKKNGSSGGGGLLGPMKTLLNGDNGADADKQQELEGIEVRPEPEVLDEDSRILSEY